MKAAQTLAIFLAGVAQAQNSSVVHIPSDWLYLLPQPLDSSIRYPWLNSTTTGDSKINNALARANQAPLFSYSDEFSRLVGHNPGVKNIHAHPTLLNVLSKLGVWLPETDEVWFTYLNFDYPYDQVITSFSLRNNSAQQVVTHPQIRYPLGGYYYNGIVYFTEFNATTDPATIITLDPKKPKSSPRFLIPVKASPSRPVTTSS